MGSRKKAEFLRCVFSSGMRVVFPSEVRWNRKTKLSERRCNVQFTTVHEDRGEGVLAMFMLYHNLCSCFLFEFNKVAITSPLYMISTLSFTCFIAKFCINGIPILLIKIDTDSIFH